MQALGNLIVECYFTPVLLFAIQILTVVVSVRNRKKFTELRYFHFYPIASLAQTLITLVSMTVTDGYIPIQYASTSLFLFIEFLLLYIFFFRVINGKIAFLILKVPFFAYFAYSIYNWIFAYTIFKLEQ